MSSSSAHAPPAWSEPRRPRGLSGSTDLRPQCAFLSPLECALTKRVRRKFFRMCSYMNPGRGVYPDIPPVMSHLRVLSPYFRPVFLCFLRLFRPSPYLALSRTTPPNKSRTTRHASRCAGGCIRSQPADGRRPWPARCDLRLWKL